MTTNTDTNSTNSTPAPVARVRLWGYSDDIVDSVRSLLFGELVDRTHAHVEHYRSDYFRDAQWVSQYVDGPVTFYYAAAEWGTGIGTDWETVRLRLDRGSDLAWRVVLDVERGQWFATFYRWDPAGECFATD